MALKPRVTPRTDSRGTVNADFKGLYGVTALKAARKAGVPGDLLHPAGWNGDPNDLTGFFAEQIYRVGEINWTVPDAIEQLADAIDAMLAVCRSYGVDPKAAIPYGMAKFKRQLHEARERHAALVRGDADLPLADEADVCWGQW